MAFRIRRGTDTERLSIAPAEGELLYTTDTGNIYVGDGSTTGGNLVTTSLLDETSPELGANLDLGGNNIVGTGNINITGTITATGDINLGDGAEDNVIVGGQIQSSLIPSTDNTFDLGAVSSTWKAAYFSNFYGDFVDSNDSLLVDGNTGDAALGNVIADSFSGNLINDDSSVIVNTELGFVSTEDIIAPFNTLNVSSEGTGLTSFVVRSIEDRSTLQLVRASDSDLTAENFIYGSVIFNRDDINGVATTSVVGAGRDNLFLVHNTDEIGDPGNIANFVTLEQGSLTIGGDQATAKLDVRGDAKVASSLQFGSLTDTERNSLTPQNGMVIYNTTTDRFQGYQAGAWINLDDGTVA